MTQDRLERGDMQIAVDKSEVRTTVPIEHFDIEDLRKLVVSEQLNAGDDVVVKIFDHYKTRLLYEGQFRVTVMEEVRVRRTDGHYNTREHDERHVQIAQIGHWWESPEGEAQREAKRETEPGVPAPSVESPTANIDKTIRTVTGVNEFTGPPVNAEDPATTIVIAAPQSEWKRTANPRTQQHYVKVDNVVVFKTFDVDLANKIVAQKFLPAGLDGEYVETVGATAGGEGAA